MFTMINEDDEGYEVVAGYSCPICGYPIVTEYELDVCYKCGWYKGQEDYDIDI